MNLYRCPDCSREHRGSFPVVCWNDVHGPLAMELVTEIPKAGKFVVVSNPGTDNEKPVSDHHDMGHALHAAKIASRVLGCPTDVMVRAVDGSLTTEF